MTTERGTFDVTLTRASPELEGAISRTEMHKSFHGGLEGDGNGILLSVGNPSSGSAGYVAIETVRGAIHDRRGGFTFLQLATMHAGSQSLRYEIAPGSGRGELSGITGSLQLTIEADGTHRYALT